jgi:type II secretory pathway component GspD/PulD (secretin)
VQYLHLRRVAGAIVLSALAVYPTVVFTQAPPPRPGQLQPFPLTELDEGALSADLDNRAFNLTFAQPVPIRDLLLQLVRGTALSVIPDPQVDGVFIGELKNVTVRQALNLILPPLGLQYSITASFIQVSRRQPETRLFDINYVSTDRVTAVSAGIPAGARVSTTNNADVFSDVSKGVQTVLSPQGVFNVDRKAGLLQVTDFPERLDRIATYLDAVHERVHRQVQIDARVIEVELADADAQSLDLSALINANPQAGPAASSRLMLSGLKPNDVARFLTALASVGAVSTLADPKIVAVNNETALVRATAGDEGVTLAVTPQIGGEGVIMLSLSPMVGITVTEAQDKKPAVIGTREADTLARLADGETLIVGGFLRDREVRTRTTGLAGGWFGRSTTVTKKRVELLVLLTPRILNPVGAQ